MKRYYLLSFFFACIINARNPFVLPKPIAQTLKKNIELKGIVIGAIPTACIRFNNTDNLVCVGDTIGQHTVIQIHGETVRLRHQDGSIKTLLLAEEKRVEG